MCMYLPQQVAESGPILKHQTLIIKSIRETPSQARGPLSDHDVRVSETHTQDILLHRERQGCLLQTARLLPISEPIDC